MGSSPNFGDPASPHGVVRPKGLWRRAKDAFQQEAMEFCLFTGLHGYKYIVQPGKHRAERMFWTLTVAVSMAAAVWLMIVAYDFNRSHPTILAVDTTHNPLWKVDAPGVTVCPSNKVFKSRAIRLVQSLDLPADVTEDEVLSDLGLLVELIAPRATNTTPFTRLQNILDKNSLSVDQVLRRVTPTCDELMVRCLWKRRQCLHCSDIFRMVPTAYGYCCSFNYMDRDIHNYKPRIGGCVGVSYQDVQRLSACGYTNGLSVTVRIRPEEYMSSFLASHGVMVMIHNPTQYPDGNADLKVVGAGTVSFISYLAQVTQATKRLRKKVSADIRKCHFPDEMFLPMFRTYTFENCMASCQANRTLAVCGCVPVTYPPIPDRKICNLLDTPCVSGLVSDPSPQRKVLNASMCPLCRPLCENIEYSVETSVGELDFEYEEGQVLTQGLGLNESEFAIFHVFANDLVTTMYKMDEYMTREDLLGSLGGLSGLFVGFSLVSGFEFVYFFTIRPFFRMRARQAASRAASRAASAAAPFNGSAPP
ncbi:sodium channel protein Nach-like, partial [Thrips palmi]|uniref:Sodium channel protein Nach-like n=1 Tax=Thrips palmi TaxID=161013 RepID=A0A6P8Z144_THRPL